MLQECRTRSYVQQLNCRTIEYFMMKTIVIRYCNQYVESINVNRLLQAEMNRLNYKDGQEEGLIQRK